MIESALKLVHPDAVDLLTMLTPIAVATWISMCIPWAEPRLAAALVAAGSGGEPLMIANAKGEPLVAKSLLEARAKLKELPAKDEVFIGLMQIPASSLDKAGIARDAALDTCGNLEIGYQLLTQSHAIAEKAERSPWKVLSIAFNHYRDGKILIDTPYSRKVVDYLMKSRVVDPAPSNSPLRHEVVAGWSAGLANRVASRTSSPRPSVLSESVAIARWARLRQ